MPDALSDLQSPFLNLDEELVGKLRVDLTAAKWNVETVDTLVSPMGREALGRDQLTPAVLDLEGTFSPAATLTKLFILAQAVPTTEVESALPTLSLQGALTLGLLNSAGSGDSMTRAVVDLRPHAAALPSFAAANSDEDDNALVDHHWWVASDLGQAQTGLPPRDDYVLGIASASTNLLRLTSRRHVQSALDLGCGCGILAIYLTTHADHVVATDISPRACNFTRFNAMLNKCPIEVVEGSLFEPVAGQRFDLVTSNPPFVITPNAVRERAQLDYRDGGMERDSLIPRVIKDAVNHLNPGGTLQMLANWEVSGEESNWPARPSKWIEAAVAPALERGEEARAWLVQRDLVGVAQYAEWWIRDSKGDRVDKESWDTEYAEWLRDFANAGTRYVGLGFLALRMNPGKLSDLKLICEYLPDGLPADGIAVETALNNLALPKTWPVTPMVRAEDVREVRYLVPGEADPELVRITQGRPGGRERTVSSAVAAIIGVSDGDLTPAQVIPAIALLLEREPDQIRAEIEDALPELLRSGVLSFAESNQSSNLSEDGN